MAQEIERKFLVNLARWRPPAAGVEIRQGYLNSHKARTVRIRVNGSQGFLTVKGATHGITRQEFEYEIPRGDAEELLKLCEQPIIEKTRYIEPIGGHVWQIDVFRGSNAGLVVAEIELTGENETFAMPVWAGKEVSGDPRYFNANLIAHPFCQWG